jgi:hypothetical protein
LKRILLLKLIEVTEEVKAINTRIGSLDKRIPGMLKEVDKRSYSLNED